MTQAERELHERMNAAIEEAVSGLLAEFDITNRDLGKAGQAELQILRGNIKPVLLRAYLRNHTI